MTEQPSKPDELLPASAAPSVVAPSAGCDDPPTEIPLLSGDLNLSDAVKLSFNLSEAAKDSVRITNHGYTSIAAALSLTRADEHRERVEREQRKATGVLQQNGIKVGLLGANMSQL